jgi:Fe-S cluster assembly iron-binding protein IscA
MGKPEDTGNHSVFQADGITFYVEAKILQEYLEDGKITFHLDQYGSFDLNISDN